MEARKEELILNYKKVEENVINACKKANRKKSEVLILPVSKTKPTSDIKILKEYGITEFGENYVQELVEKMQEVEDVKFHMIGNLQRNKVKYIYDKIECIHSVCSYKLAKEINDKCEKINRKIDVLVEVNIGSEENKIGIKKEEAIDFIREISHLPYIRVVGLMTSAPYVLNPEENRQYFKEMKDLSVDIDSEKIDNVEMKHLSMGMTNDYMVAIEEGATIVRVGTAIFGSRNYNKD